MSREFVIQLRCSEGSRIYADLARLAGVTDQQTCFQEVEAAIVEWLRDHLSALISDVLDCEGDPENEWIFNKHAFGHIYRGK